MTEFTTWCLLGSLFFNIVGIWYKFFPPQKVTWWGPGLKIPSALKTMETWKEGNNFIAFPALITGSLFVLVAFIPEFFGEINFFVFRSPLSLILFATIILLFLTDRHLKKVFDKNGNRR